MARRHRKSTERNRRRNVQRTPRSPAVGHSAAETAAPPVPPPVVAATRRSGPQPTPTGVGVSRLSDRAAAEYHYVLRDLRNIGVLVMVMAALLAGAVVAFNLLGIGPS